MINVKSKYIEDQVIITHSESKSIKSMIIEINIINNESFRLLMNYGIKQISHNLELI